MNDISKVIITINSNNVVTMTTNKFKPLIFSANDKNDYQQLIEAFQEMSKNSIKTIVKAKNDVRTIVFKNSQRFVEVTFENYSKFKNKDYFKLIKEKIQKYNINSLANKIKKQLNSKVIGIAIAGSLVSSATVITFANQLTNNERFVVENQNTEENTNKITSDKIIEVQESIENSLENIPDNIEPNNYEKDSIQNEPLNSEDSLTPNNNIEKQEESSKNDIDMSNQQANTVINDEPVDFSELKNYTNYDEYIRFAAKLHYIDYETAKQVVAENMEHFTNSDKIVSYELNRMKDLKEKGIIDGDINVMGIFITIKNYSVDNPHLSSQEPIKSNKTNAEREQDLINIATNIYGITDIDMLNCIIAVHRIETGNGNAPITTEHNNLGGNIDPESDYNNPKHIIYKTTEIGAESAVRNFLNIYDKCFYDERCNPLDPIPSFMCQIYCPHTPEDWAREVGNKMEEVSDIVNSYLGNNVKTH